MKATFGKLEHQTLTLKPGLNIIEAPNEWGKSTWCAFLICMLYGIDTRSKSTRCHLADKERFVPWSGSPMEGRIDLQWQGRDITIERSTKGRIPMGEFRAYETYTGLDVPELTAENCGYQLLGVEKDVFTRSGFLSFADLPVTEDDQLRSRLNALVTTGDESGSAELLEQRLKELKRRCRYNKTGLIPQLRMQKENVEQTLQEWESLDSQIRQLQIQITRQERKIHALENHRAALRYRAAQEHSLLIGDAKLAQEDAQRQLDTLQDQIEAAPTRDTAAKNLQQLTKLQEDLSAIAMEEQMLPPASDIPQPPAGFEGCTARQAVIQAQRHRDEINSLCPKRNLLSTITLLLGSFLVFYAAFLLVFERPVWCLVCGSVGCIYLAVCWLSHRRSKKRLSLFQKRQAEFVSLYHSGNPDLWVEAAEEYARQWEEYVNSDNGSAEEALLIRSRKEKLIAKSMVLTRGRGLEYALDYWNDIVSLWDEYADVRCNYRQVSKQYRDLQALCADAPAPKEEDPLTYSEDTTERLLTEASQELGQLLSKMGQYRGYADSLGNREALEEQNTALEQRLNELEKTYAALDLALKSLNEASAQLQRRFAPRISRTTQEILSHLTNGRYTRLSLAQDFSLHISTEDEDTLRSRYWRSDGTVDQLYLALRLAVARELIPDAPLVLDDAMVRFDNTRLRAAMELLREEAKRKQVIVFTCHGREQYLLDHPQ